MSKREPGMTRALQIQKSSSVPVRQQIAEQVLFQIASGRLQPNDDLPSVRQLARQLGVHHNTVSQAYQDLSNRGWISVRPGRKARVLSPKQPGQELDDLINATVRLAREKGFSLQELVTRVVDRLHTEAADHVLVVAEEPGLRQLLEFEITSSLRWPVKGCSLDELARDEGLQLGAQIVTPLIYMDRVEPLVSKQRPPIPVVYEPTESLVQAVREMTEPSIVAVVSVSRRFLHTATSLLTPGVGEKHTLQEYLFPLESPNATNAADIVFCDSIAHRSVKHRRAIHYRLISMETLEAIAEPFNVSLKENRARS